MASSSNSHWNARKKQTDTSSNATHRTTGMRSKGTHIKYNGKEFKKTLRQRENRPSRLTQCCTQFKSPVFKIPCVLYLRYNLAFTCKWYGNFWNKTFYSQRVWIGYNIELADLVYVTSIIIVSQHLDSFVQHGWRDINSPKMTMFLG